MNLRWEELSFCLLTPEQQIQLKNQAETHHYEIGNIIWSTDKPGNQFLIISGKVRLREEGQPQSLATLESGDWFGDLLELSGHFKAVAKDSANFSK
ncbi:MAG: cyclic nucleotide-binding domain-containing protein [Scytonema sp. RU_4_4]|nr:cyclic nucleotide-binding domain-containing protein [Scytonema sp. RU_4_4]NJR73739.1 cyclic nucleotide-binding domain-containing protein [Scytonema sp. CRU_2_7]